jgi:hypothetical protein
MDSFADAIESSAPMARVFISYRREDSKGYAGRIYDRLAMHFGAANVFMDIDSLEPGVDFVEKLQPTVESCDVFIAVLGPGWLSARDKQGRDRLSNPDDFVANEIVAALESPHVRLVPILVDGASMPRSTELPKRLSGLARRHALVLPDIGFQQTLGRLIQSIERKEQERLAQEEAAQKAEREPSRQETEEERITPQTAEVELAHQEIEEERIGALEQRSHSSAVLWLISSLVAFLCCVASVTLLVAFGARISQYGPTRGIYFLVLLVSSLLTAALFWRALRAYGKYKGKLLSGTFELGGPTVVLFLVVVLGLRFASPLSTFNLVVRPHGPSGLTDSIREGSVTLYLRSNSRTEQIGTNGQAQFNEIPSIFQGASIDFRVDVPGYTTVTKSPIQIPEDEIVYILLAPEKPDSILSGTLVSGDNQPERNARVIVNQGLAVGVTDDTGRFVLHVPLSQGTIVNLKIISHGITGFDNSVPVAEDLTLTFAASKVHR